ncbi:Uncharacterized protein Fot_05139 [Forsythia ovata]|uniref:RNase H type-1 domain-containing protein n=1 Tax=Forsythia ovata TaxID=205694 RepID=A0ABD1WPA3_9LAMI
MKGLVQENIQEKSNSHLHPNLWWIERTITDGKYSEFGTPKLNIDFSIRRETDYIGLVAVVRDRDGIVVAANGSSVEGSVHAGGWRGTLPSRQICYGQWLKNVNFA